MVPLALNFITTSELAIYLASIPLFVLILAKLILKETITLKKAINEILNDTSVAEENMEWKNYTIQKDMVSILD